MLREKAILEYLILRFQLLKVFVEYFKADDFPLILPLEIFTHSISTHSKNIKAEFRQRNYLK